MPRSGHKPDYSLMAALFVLLIFGLIMQSLAGSVIAFDKFDDSYFYFKRQFGYFAVGLLFMLVLSRIPYQRYKKYYKHFFVLAVVLLLLVFIPGVGTSYGTIARSWINVGGVSFQPSEAVKLLYILALAGWFEVLGRRGIKHFKYGLGYFLGSLALIGGLVAAQPDLGTLGVIVLVSVTMFFAAGAKTSHLLLIATMGVGMIASLAVLSPRRFTRLTTFLNPAESDPLGVGYHIKQALIGIGSGGFFGVGLGHSRQKFSYLPEAMGDSIFVIIGEELGFFLSSGLVVLFLYIAYKAYSIAWRSRDVYGKLVAVGIMTWVVGQAFINIGAMLGVLPLTGLPLPFISFGGTALVTMMAAMGILLNISRYTKK